MSRSFLPSTAAQRGVIAIAAAGFLWGTTGVVVQLIRQSTGLSPVSLGFCRLAIAALALLIFLARRLRPVVSALRAQPGLLALIGVGLGAYQALYFLAVAWGGVAMATVVSLGLAPVLIAGGEAARSRRVPARGTLFSVTTAVLGLALITGFEGAPTEAAPRPLAGLLAAVGSGIGYAGSTVLSRRVSRHTQPVVLTTVSTAVGALTLLPFALVSNDLPGLIMPATAAMLAYLGVAATAVAYGLFYAGLRTTAAGVTVVLTLLEPLTAALLAVVILGERLTVPITVGGLLLLGAVVTASRSHRQAPGRRETRRPGVLTR
ncbi:EamA family transporter [Actinoplanes sp. ATCC 53533]|uniref:DMT family transporter n=1 Tax=Actinoplanes sp. ATCC 53533 TaxID=1288362 RepID=UPI000F78FD7F|nr:EamA family transporter [Actinoplanes sp. ATCC 53533]RSM56695.1 EamA family transporter [Actinoplanes sp. ATCC 53533]